MRTVFPRRILTDPFRKFSTEAPVYTSKTAPKKLVIGKHDIGEFHMNDGSEGARVLKDREVVAMAEKAFMDAKHGQAARIGESLDDASYGLSATSAPLFLNFGRKWQRKGLGGFVKPVGEPELVKPNVVAKWIADARGQYHQLDDKFIQNVNKHVNEINKLGYSFPLAQRVNGDILIPNIGFLKYKKGGSLNEKVTLLQKRNSLVRKNSISS